MRLDNTFTHLLQRRQSLHDLILFPAIVDLTVPYARLLLYNRSSSILCNKEL